MYDDSISLILFLFFTVGDILTKSKYCIQVTEWKCIYIYFCFWVRILAVEKLMKDVTRVSNPNALGDLMSLTKQKYFKLGDYPEHILLHFMLKITNINKY